MVKTVRLGRKEFRRQFGGEFTAFTTKESGKEPTIYLQGKPSSRTRLHEIYHAKYSPVIVTSRNEPWESVDDVVAEELSAEDFTETKSGKEGLHFASLVRAGEHAISVGFGASRVMGATKRILDRLGYGPFSRELQSALWWRLKEIEKQKKESR